MITTVQFYDPQVISGAWVPKSNEPFMPPEPCEAVGHVLYEDKHWIVLASLHSPSNINTLITLHKGSIVKRKDYA